MSVSDFTTPITSRRQLTQLVHLDKLKRTNPNEPKRNETKNQTGLLGVLLASGTAIPPFRAAAVLVMLVQTIFFAIAAEDTTLLPLSVVTLPSLVLTILSAIGLAVIISLGHAMGGGNRLGVSHATESLPENRAENVLKLTQAATLIYQSSWTVRLCSS